MSEGALKKKYCLVGDGAVGKTSLIRRFVLDQFDDRYITTIGTKVTKRSVSISDKQMEMMLWDIMGQQGYRSVLQDQYFKGASGIVAVCDVTRVETLVSLESWVVSVRNVCGEVPLLILANKADLREQMRVTPDMLKSTAVKHDAIGGYYTSAKTGANVEKSFLDMARISMERE